MKTTTRTWGWLVVAAARRTMAVTVMARRTMAGAMMAAALVLGMTACSSDDTIAEEPVPQQPANAAVTADGKVHVTVGAGIGDDGETRSAVVETEYEKNHKVKTRRTLTFTLPKGTEGQPGYSPGDRLYIHGSITPYERTMGGMLNIKSVSDGGKSATFEGELTVKVKEGSTWKDDDTGWADKKTGDPMTWYGTNDITGMLIHAATDIDDIYTIDKDDGHIEFNHDKSLVTGDGDLANKLMESAIEVSGYYNSEGRFELECSDAIFNCTFSGLAKTTSYKISIWKEDDIINSYEQSVTTDGNGTARFAISNNMFGGDDDHFLKLSPNDDSGLLICNLGKKEFTPKVYNMKRNWTGTTFVAPQTINLAEVTGDVMLRNGDVLTGTLDGSTQKVKISIAPGATVTLQNAHINGQHYDDTDFPGAGINCLGDATIVLSGENTVTNFNRYYPAILAAHNATGSGTEYTLTISGSGKLTATNANFGAAIGGGDRMDCGNIAITGGTIKANGGGNSAAIGGGQGANCGSITISGGTVTAMAKASTRGVGIGSGYSFASGASCGNITISGTASVTATGGGNGAGIGSSGARSNCANTCGNISISGPCTVNATGGEGAAGIGTGEMAKCGDVNITGGTVTAQGGSNAAGIGCGKGESGRKSECGAITIKTIEGYEADFTSVTAIRGQGGNPRPIGHSSSDSSMNTCGTITFSNNTVYTAGNNPGNYNTGGISGLNFEQTTTDLGGGENYMNNTWKLWR